SVEAVAAADETHRLAAPWSRTPGRYDLILTVVSDGAADVLSLTLQVPDRSSTPAPAASSLKPINGGFDRRSGPLRFRRTSRGRVGRSRLAGTWLVKGFGRFCRTKAVTGRPPDPNSDLKRLCYVLRGEFW
ncbi:MAG: hypothetical protein ACXWU8_09315, partial [Rhodoplanes sp.]